MEEDVKKFLIEFKNEMSNEANKVLQEYWANIVDYSSGTFKEFFKLKATETIKTAYPYIDSINITTKLYDGVSLITSEFKGKADRLGVQGAVQLQEFFEGMSSKLLQEQKIIKNDIHFNDIREASNFLRDEAKTLKGISKVFDKLGPAATFIDLGMRASKGDFAGMSAGALGSAAGLWTIAALGAASWPAAGVILAGAIIGLGTDEFFKYIFTRIGLRKVDDETNKNFNDAHGFIPRVDPLAIDLNGDGVQTISIDSGVLFDFNDDQMRTGTGWLDANDGFLVYDRNGNGVIDNGSELFGVDTRKSDGSLATDGFDALRDLDSNGDGVFNAEDADFGNVRVWQDKNSDGISQADELKRLDELGITAINLDSQETNIDSNGNRIAATGTVEFADGSTSTAANLDLSSNPFYRKYTDTIEISEEIAALPDMQGSGPSR